jgi:hypothetical protein
VAPALAFLQSGAVAHGVASWLAMESGMSRREANTSAYRRQSDTLTWTVGWRLGALVQGKGDPVLLHHVDDRSTMSGALDALLAANVLPPSLAVDAAPLRADCALLMRVEGSPANAPQFYLLQHDDSLRAALAGTSIIEFPIFTVVPRSALASFCIVPKPPPAPTSLVIEPVAPSSAPAKSTGATLVQVIAESTTTTGQAAPTETVLVQPL